MNSSLNQISSAMALAGFRKENNGLYVLSLLKKHPHLLINWAVGVGKSTNMDQVIEYGIESGQYDLIIVLAPTRAIINERDYIQFPPENIKITNLRPRPKELCGKQRNADWADYEQRGLSILGKRTICALCPNQEKCHWKDQFGDVLRGTQVLFATQAHLTNDLNFIARMKAKCEAQNVLVIFDEATVSLTPYSRTITQEEIANLIFCLCESDISQKRKAASVFALQSLLNAATDDLREPDVWSMPSIYPTEIRELVTIGERHWPGEFRNIHFDLQALMNSPLDSREKTEFGDIRFSATPLAADCDVLLYSGTTHETLLNHKLGLNFHNFYQDTAFKGDGTQWLNIASSLGTSGHFLKNSPQILDFFLELTLKRIREGKRVLLISKKKHKQYCIDTLNEMLTVRSIDDVQIVDGEEYDSNGTITQIPVIHYGVIGINQFEQFDCAYCLNSYYVTKTILANALQDMRASDEQLEMEIKVLPNPRRRHARIADNKYRYTDVAQLTDPMLQTLEMGTVIQAVGRVRPFTSPCEVITFQNNPHPNYQYDAEFNNLAEIREHFGIDSQRARTTGTKKQEIQQLKQQSLTQKQVAEQLGIGVRTVRRYWSGQKS
ncbi:hypothetical protein NI392_06570 [Vibrio alginolyticus]|uniref:helix-turn-helix transcriptional regulator n=2 Tax=Vibrio TaxID=662 RepID=UPI00146A7994|nr:MULTISPECIES: helix-turn-helix transcriptional regulator [Vibrio]MDF4657341.1 helix-turn-helix transcriptional regulator [Vibrio parahaemolyticus]MDW2063109.1 helix-turn-helix transcriptional regulator [Vibrio sp. 1579]MDW2168575.1 helix-turn-helix transcriptional regulator [Vibrio sp. 1567]MDW2265617.1 helix-turn-helix transcriptional regulator [Vibrio sp. 1557]MDW2318367.1 helix-turn-helix transcriptional regulator [Vibrio sp. 1456-1]MDW3142277.1 helix-turn-helix transcriptional regulato